MRNAKYLGVPEARIRPYQLWTTCLVRIQPLQCSCKLLNRTFVLQNQHLFSMKSSFLMGKSSFLYQIAPACCAGSRLQLCLSGSPSRPAPWLFTSLPSSNAHTGSSAACMCLIHATTFVEFHTNVLWLVAEPSAHADTLPKEAPKISCVYTCRRLIDLLCSYLVEGGTKDELRVSRGRHAVKRSEVAGIQAVVPRRELQQKFFVS